MQAVTFNSKLENQIIRVPDKYRDIFQQSKDIKVIVLFDEKNSDRDDFMNLTQTQFLSGYADSDSIYDE